MGIDISVMWHPYNPYSVFLNIYIKIDEVIIMCLLFRIYQTRTTSLHAHPGVKHRNGRAYNDKAGGISRTQKAYDCRDIVWTKKYRICIRVTSECGKNLPDDLGQHGGNWMEWTHSAMKLSFKEMHFGITFHQHK